MTYYAAVSYSLATWRAIAAALDATGTGHEPGLADRIRRSLDAWERHGYATASLDLWPADAAVVAALRHWSPAMPPALTAKLAAGESLDPADFFA